MDMTGWPEMSMYDCMIAEGWLPEWNGLVMLTIKRGAGLVRSDTGHRVEACEVKKDGFFKIPKDWERVDLPYHRIRGIAEKHKPSKGADFYFPVIKGEMLSAIQYYRSPNGK